nr:leucine-rich repeat extensin-like protein 1 [Ipomoea trifida]
MRWELGHQNAHRRERAMDRTVKRSRRGAFMYPFYRFAGLSPLLAGAGAVQWQVFPPILLSPACLLVPLLLTPIHSKEYSRNDQNRI